MTDLHNTDLKWQKARRSGAQGNCVEVASDGASILIRDSKYLRTPSNKASRQPILTLSKEQWEQFKEAVGGKHSYTEPRTVVHPSGAATIRAHDGTALEFTPAEWLAFKLGIRDGEFDSVAA